HPPVKIPKFSASCHHSSNEPSAHPTRLLIEINTPAGFERHPDLPGAEKSYYFGNNAMEKPMVELKVRKFGNSLGVVLPKEVISRLNTEEGAPLYLTEAAEGGYRLVPYDPDFERKMAKAEDIMQRYRDTLHVLAK